MEKTQVIKKNKHFTRFRDRFWGLHKTPLRVSSAVVLSGPGLRYNHNNQHQRSWNKLAGGLYFNLYNPHGQSVIIGWRYNEPKDVIEVTFYYHGITDTEGYQSVGTVPGWIIPSKVLEIPIINDEATIYIIHDIRKSTESVTTELRSPNGDYLQNKAYFEKIGAFHTKGNSYFGGKGRTKGKVISKYTE